MEKIIESHSINQMILQKDQEILKLKEALDFDLDDENPSGPAVEALRLLIQQRNQLKNAAFLIENPEARISAAQASGFSEFADSVQVPVERVLKTRVFRDPHSSAPPSRSKYFNRVIGVASVCLLFGPGLWVYFNQAKITAPRIQAEAVQSGNGSERTAERASTASRVTVPAATAPIVTAPLAVAIGPKASFQYSEVFNDLELTSAGKAKLRAAAVIFANALGSVDHPVKTPREFSIRVYHSPTFHEKLTDVNSRTSQAYKNKLRSTNTRAQNVFNFLFGDEIGFYPNKTLLQSITRARGMSFENPVRIERNAPRDKICGEVDCTASRRVELEFSN